MAGIPDEWVEIAAARAGMTLPLAEAARVVVADALEDAVDAVAGHIRKPPFPVAVTESGVSPDGRGGWRLTNGPILSIDSVTLETDPISGDTTGLYTITYRAGMDPETNPAYGRALRRYVLAHAAASASVARVAPGGRAVRSVSVEGQSVTYDTPQAGSGSAGAAPTLTSLDPWRRRGVYQEPGIAPHPLEGMITWR